MRSTLERSIKAGDTVTKTASDLLKVAQPEVHLPRYVRELSEAAKKGKTLGLPNPLEDAVAKWRSTVDRLGQGAEREAGPYTIRSATQQLVKDLQKARPETVDKVVSRWVTERARYQAGVVARNESVEAFRDAQLKSYEGQEWVKGVRWTLSPRHPHREICDVLANQDLYGLGPGGYPIDKVPERHVGCLCSLSSIADTEHFAREQAKAKGEPEPPKAWLSGAHVTGDDWIRMQPAAVQREILGPTRATLFARGQSVMSADGSSLRPVADMINSHERKAAE